MAAPSTVLLAITAPSRPNSAWSATSPRSEQLLPAICRFEALCARIAENADKTREGDVVGVVGRRQWTILCRDDPGRPGHSDEVTASGELKMARPVDAGRKHQWDARAAGALDGPQQHLGLVIRTSRLDPEVDGIDAERRDRGHRGRSTGGPATRADRTACEAHAERT